MKPESLQEGFLIVTMTVVDSLHLLQDEVKTCTRCTRLRAHSLEVARVKRSAYRNWEYWGRPVPSFGDPHARILVIGLAPGAHGANRTGRMFTGDSSGDFLYRALYATDFASQPEATAQNDGLQLKDCYITAAARCAPPDNKPTREEFTTCNPFLVRELEILPNIRVVVALGHLALAAYLSVLQYKNLIKKRSDYPFRHGKLYNLGDRLPDLVCCYHPSRQNTQTGRLTMPMILGVFRQVRRRL